MQNLFLKLLVLSGVIGGSCFVVWQAHEGLMSATGQLDLGEFVSLPEEESAAQTDPDQKKEHTPEVAEAADDWEHPLNLAVTLPEPEPTLATAPAQSEESPAQADADPLLASRSAMPLPAGNQEESSDPSGLPLFFGDQELASSDSKKKEPQPIPASEALPESPIPAESPENSNIELASAEFAMKSEVAPREFLELPDQQVERPEPETPSELNLPEAKPLEVAQNPVLPDQSEAAEFNKNRFGPAVAAESPPELTATESPQPENAREMPGLTRLPASHPGPVLLPIEATEPPPAKKPTSGAVVTADAVESELDPIRKASDSMPSEAPREFLPENATPLEPTPTRSSVQSSPENDPFAADPFGGSPTKPAVEPESSTEPEPTPRKIKESPKTTEVLPESLPEVIPAGGMPRTNSPKPTNSDLARRFGIQQTAGEFPAESTPPLPPTGEVLPDIIPNSSGGSTLLESMPAEEPALSNSALPNKALPLPASEIPASEEVLPLSIEPTELPEPVNAENGLNANPAFPSGFPGRESPAVLPDLSSNALPTPSPLPTQPSVFGMEEPAPEANQLLGTTEFDATAPRGPQSPELKIEKIAPSDAEVGEAVIYSIIIRNVGGSAARDVVVEDRIPRGSQLEGTIPQAYLNEGKLSWQLGTLEPGAERKIQLKVVPVEAGQIGSVATVSFASTVAASINVTSPELSIKMESPSEAVLGEPMNIRFTLRNSGQSMAKSVYLRTILPAGIKHPGGNDLEYEAGALAPGEEKVIDLVVLAEREEIFTIHAQVNNEGKKHEETQADVNVIKSRLEIVRTGPENRFVGRPADCMLKVTNTSSDVLKNITIQEKIAPGIELAAIPGGGHWDPRERLITWKQSELKPGGFREIRILYVAKEAGDHAGTIVAADESGNRSQIQTKLNVKGFADLTLDMNADQRTVLVGERITLKLVAKNVGSAAGNNIRTQFILPEGVEFAAARGPVEYQLNDKIVQFDSLANLPAGSEQTFHLAVVAKAPGTSKITMKVEADDYDEPVFQDQAIRIIQ